jgi:tetratricopeptide (TPR) repeat protein
MDRSLGIEQFENGQRLQAAGEYANAIQYYQLALDGRFEDPKYRTFALKALGTLLWWREGPEAALPYLEEAFRSPDAPITLYAPLCDSLLRVGRLEDITQVCERWYSDAGRQNDTGQQAEALYYLGRMLQERGDETGSLARFYQGVQHHPGGNNAYELGLAYYRAGDSGQALTYLEQYLETGTGGRAEYAREVRGRILSEPKPAAP